MELSKALKFQHEHEAGYKDSMLQQDYCIFLIFDKSGDRHMGRDLTSRTPVSIKSVCDLPGEFSQVCCCGGGSLFDAAMRDIYQSDLCQATKWPHFYPASEFEQQLHRGTESSMIVIQ